MRDCEEQLLSFLCEHTPRGACLLAGNSVGQDAKFLSRLMPELMEHLGRSSRLHACKCTGVFILPTILTTKSLTI